MLSGRHAKFIDPCLWPRETTIMQVLPSFTFAQKRMIEENNILAHGGSHLYHFRLLVTLENSVARLHMKNLRVESLPILFYGLELMELQIVQ